MQVIVSSRAGDVITLDGLEAVQALIRATLTGALSGFRRGGDAEMKAAWRIIHITRRDPEDRAAKQTFYWRAKSAAASFARSMNGSPLTSMTTFSMVPPVKAYGASPA